MVVFFNPKEDCCKTYVLQQSHRFFTEKVLTNGVRNGIMFKHVRESVGMVDKHV